MDSLIWGHLCHFCHTFQVPQTILKLAITGPDIWRCDWTHFTSCDLASVVRLPKYLTQWPLLEEDEPLAQLHAKFWGKDMADEEQRWRLSQPTIGVIEGQDHDETMDTDSEFSDGEEEPEKAIPGCYVLDIDVEGLEVSSLWIHPDYIKIYDAVKDHYDYCAGLRGRAPSVVVTGHLGTGELCGCFIQLYQLYNSFRKELLDFLRATPTPR